MTVALSGTDLSDEVRDELELDQQPAPEADNTAADADSLKAIWEARENVRRRKDEYEDLKEQARSAKKEWEDAVDQLGSTIDARTRSLPLFDRNQGPAEQPEQPPAPETRQEKQSWRDVRLDSLSAAGLTSNRLKTLASAEIETIGDLVDFQGKHGETWARQIKGFGAKAREVLDDALDAFWADQNGRAAAANDHERR